MELDVWQKIVDDPFAELEELAHRIVRHLEDSQYITDHVKFHYVMMAWSQVGRLARELEVARNLAELTFSPNARDYGAIFEGKRSMALTVIRVIREQLDELDARDAS